MKSIYTYHDDVPELHGVYDGREILSMWAEAWGRHGWTCRVLSRVDAEKNPLFPAFCEGVAKLRTSNPRKYEDACYLRYLAMQSVLQPGEFGFMTDADVLPVVPWDVPVSPGVLHVYSRDYIEGGQLCPCAVAGDGATFGSAVQFFMGAAEWFCGAHASDQVLLRSGRHPVVQHADVMTFGDPRSVWAKAIHYKTDALRFYQGTKSQRMRHAIELGKQRRVC